MYFLCKFEGFYEAIEVSWSVVMYVGMRGNPRIFEDLYPICEDV